MFRSLAYLSCSAHQGSENLWAAAGDGYQDASLMEANGKQPTKEELLAMFKLIDADGSGKLERAEAPPL